MVMPGETVDTGAPLPYEGAQPEVLSSGGGRYFIGYNDEDGLPYTRESEYYRTYEEAEEALEAGTYSRGLVPRPWRQRGDRQPKVETVETDPRPPGVSPNAKLETEATLELLQHMREDWATMHHPGDRWTLDEIQWVEEQRSDGRAWKDIAVAIDRCRVSATRPSQVATSVRNAVDTWHRFGRLTKFREDTFVSFQEWRKIWVNR